MGLGVPRRTQRDVARKFWKYMKDNEQLLPTRTELRMLYLNTFRPTLLDSLERRVPFGRVMWAFRTKVMRVVVWKEPGEREEITYCTNPNPILAVDHNYVLRRQANILEDPQREVDDLNELRKKVVTEKREFLAKDKGDITISPAADENGEVCIPINSKVVQLKVSNKSLSKVSLRCVQLGSGNDFDIDDRVHKIASGGKTAELGPFSGIEFTVQIKASNPGIYCVPVAFMFRRGIYTPELFHIVKYVKAEIEDEIVTELQPVMPYVRPRPVARVTEPEVEIIPGEPPPMQSMRYIIPLQNYKIPSELRHKINCGKLQDPLLQLSFRREITAERHQERFSKLLHIEELQMEVDIHKYTMDKAQLVRKDGFLTLAVPGLAENRPSLVRGDRLFVRQLSAGGTIAEKKEYEGFVHLIGLNEVYLKFSSTFHNNFIRGSSYQVRFSFSRTSLKLMHRAVEKARRFLSTIPSKVGPRVRAPDVDTTIRCYDQKIDGNREQKQAVENIVAGTSHPYPYLVFGPPGTGKTVTMVEAIKQVLNSSRQTVVLACAPSNSAADLILERVAEHQVVPKTQMIRLNAFSRSESSVNEKIKEFCILSGDGFFHFPPIDTIAEYRLVVTTLISAGRLHSLGMAESHFTHIFIDEAGHGMEPECFVALAGLLGPQGHLVLAGDPKQLGPVLRSPVAIKYGLGVSFLERLMSPQFPCYGRQAVTDNYDARMVTKLLNNYRSHPSIIKLPNEMFYDNELRACADELSRSTLCRWDGLKKQGFPVIFEPVYGKDQREERSPSFFNPQEVSVVLRFVRELKEARGSGQTKMQDIGIISPYHKQVQKIRQSLQKRPLNIREIKVGSVEEFQGQERKVIIISTVRSSNEFLQLDATHKLGFLNNPKRFNVAITRAKALLIVIGNPDVLCRDEHWRSFIKYCLDNGGFGGSGSFQMPEVADDNLAAQLDKLSLNKETLQDEIDITKTDYEEPEWKPEEH